MRTTVMVMLVSGAIAMRVIACDALPMQVKNDLAADPAALRVFWTLLENARFGFSQLEQAAFLVRDANGAIASVAWAATGEPNNGRWIGAFPPNTIAIAHTHPNWMPVPSTIDMRTAERARIPVYVITRGHISRTDGGSITMVFDGDWKRALGCGKSEGAVHMAEAQTRRSDGESR